MEQLSKLTDKQCPRCGEEKLNEVKVRNALSRRDNRTWICSDCGEEEAFVDMGLYPERAWVRPVEQA